MPTEARNKRLNYGISRDRETALYRLGNIILECDFPLAIDEVKEVSAECIVRLLPPRELGRVSCNWFHHFAFPGSDPWLSCAKQNSDYLLRFHSFADFSVSSDGKTIRCHPDPATPLETIRHLLLNPVIPRVLSNRGKTVLHASAVFYDKGAIAFLGETGSGKSTLSASFYQQGFPLLTDDCLVLKEKKGKLIGNASYSVVRLWPDTASALFENEESFPRVAHYTEKKQLRLENERLPVDSDQRPLLQGYVLSKSDYTHRERVVSITTLSMRESFMELVKQSFRLDITDRKKLKDEFKTLSRVAELFPLSRLIFPHDLALLPKVLEAIIADLRNNGGFH